MAVDKDGTIRVIVTKEGEGFVAQCLEVDIGAEAQTIDELRVQLAMTLRAEFMEGHGTADDPFPHIGAAPEHFHQLWDKCEFRAPPVGVPGVDHGATYQMALCA